MRNVKAQWRLFEQTSIDTKDLDDISELWTQIKDLKLPMVQYTAPEVVSGMQYIAYALDIAKNKNPELNPNLPLLPPVFLDKLYFQRTFFQTLRGYDVINYHLF